MRLTTQGCLILLLGCALYTDAHAATPTWSYVETTNTNAISWCENSEHCLGITFYRTDIERNMYARMICPSNPPTFPSYSGTGDQICPSNKECYTTPSGGQCLTREECQNPLSHEPGGTVDETLCGVCSPGYIRSSGQYAPGSGSPVSAGYECMRNREPNECQYLDKYEVTTSQGAYCVNECAQGSLDSKCLLNIEPEDPEQPECGPDHPEFKGVIGYGGEAALVCGTPENQCPTGSSYGFMEQSDGSYKASCFPAETNPPQCPGGSAVIMGKNGISFQCGEIRNPDATPEDLHDAMTGDSDGDGEGDITGITNQLSKIQELLNRGNNTTNNINETLKGIGKQIQDGTGAITDAIGNIPGGGGGSGGNGDGNGDGDGEQENPVTWSGDPITLEVGDGLEELNAVKGEYENLIANIRSEMSAAFGSFTGQGTLQDHIFTVRGVEVNAGLSKWADALSMLGSVILFAASFVAIGIIMGAKD